MAFTRDNRDKLSYDELVTLVRELPTKEQRMMAEELRLAGLKAKWQEILAAFEANAVSDREIVRASKAVRRRLIKKRDEASTGGR